MICDSTSCDSDKLHTGIQKAASHQPSSVNDRASEPKAPEQRADQKQGIHAPAMLFCAIYFFLCMSSSLSRSQTQTSTFSPPFHTLQQQRFGRITSLYGNSMLILAVWNPSRASKLK